MEGTAQSAVSGRDVTWGEARHGQDETEQLMGPAWPH